MTPDIHTIPLGFDQCYAIRSEGVIVVDAGAPGKGQVFEKYLRGFEIEPTDVRLIVITHGHWDHLGSARAIRELTRAPIAMHECEAHMLEEGLKPLSPGVTPWGRIFTMLMKRIMPMIRFPAAEVDIRVGDEGLPLHEYGVFGQVLHTPGHTCGSLSVLLDSGEAFVGDLAMNRFPLRLTPGLPIFATDEGRVRDSWRFLMDRGARTIYPAHGKPFPAEVIKRALGDTGV